MPRLLRPGGWLHCLVSYQEMFGRHQMGQFKCNTANKSHAAPRPAYSAAPPSALLTGTF